MLKARDIAEAISKIAEGKDSEKIEKIAKRVMKYYPHKAPFILKALERIKDFDETRVLVISARELSSSEKEQIQNSISAKYNDHLEFEFEITETIGAGIIIKKGEFVIDSSLNNLINQLSDKIKNCNISIGV